MTSAKKIFVGNYKGGVGKTTSIYQIALQMAAQKKRVLLIDLDSQCSLSEICLTAIDQNLKELQEFECLNYLYDIWLQSKQYPRLKFTFDMHRLIKKPNQYFHFIPSNIFYKKGGLDELSLKLKNEFEDAFVLQQFLISSQIATDYDYILFDCPPSNNMITKGAFLLSDYYIVPTIIQTMSIRGVVHYIKTVEKIYNEYCEDRETAELARTLFGNKPFLIGIFETLKKGKVKNDDVLRQLKEDLHTANIKSVINGFDSDECVFSTKINYYEDIARETAQGKLRSEFASLTDEIIGCLEGYPSMIS